MEGMMRGAAAAEYKATSIRLNTKLADEAMKLMGAKSRTEVIHEALEEAVELRRFKKLMKKYGGKLQFAGVDEGDGASVTG
ncbi:MAG: type II toxin-antitoxin system VapB family antitoxin [Edaphobacter sp.]